LSDEVVEAAMRVMFDLLLTAQWEGFLEPYSSDKSPSMVSCSPEFLIEISQSFF
jgi:hypothetical protein